jgi:hypothetical protein
MITISREKQTNPSLLVQSSATSVLSAKKKVILQELVVKIVHREMKNYTRDG